MGDRQHATNLYNAGVKACENQAHLQQGFQNFVAAVYADPTWWQAFYQCGNNICDLKQDQAAIACWRRALECEAPSDGRARVLSNLGWRLHGLGRTEEALEFTLQALAVDPLLSHAWVNLSCVKGVMNDRKGAVEAAEKAFELAPEDSVTEVALGFACLFDRQFARGLKHMERRFDYRLTHYNHMPYPKWKGERDASVFLVADQGLGDTLSYARFVEGAALRCKFVHMCVQPELLRAFQHAFVHLKNIDLSPLPARYPPADYWTTFCSLPFALDLADEDICNEPQIELPVYSLPKTWKVPDRKFHIGISWRGSKLNEINEHRSIPIQQFLELYRVPGVQLYSLQCDESRQQLFDTGCAAVISDLSQYVRDIVGTVSLMRDLDLVITCESALGHICAAAGQEAWIPYSWLGRDYRLGNTGQDRIWCPKHRVFQQGPDMRWEPVFDRIVEALAERVGTG